MDLFRAQHRRRLSWMPWLYFSLKPQHRQWAEPWQQQVQDRLRNLETVEIAAGCFIAPEARIFAEPHRAVVIGERSSIAAEAFVHGPIRLGSEVSINARASLDGGSAGIVIGDGTRIATGAVLYAFDHQLAPDRPVREQPVRSLGIRVGEDVWIGANAGVTDGVEIGAHAVVAMGAVVTRNVAPFSIVAGAPARVIGDRRSWGGRTALVSLTGDAAPVLSSPAMNESLQDRYAPQNACFGCGPANALGLRIKSRVEGDRVVAEWMPEKHHEAFELILSGGIIGTLLDCHSNWAATHHLMTTRGSDTPPCTVTSEFAVKLKRPTPTGGAVKLRAKVIESSGDVVVVESELEAGGKICATCRGTFVAVKPGHPAYHRW